MSNLQNQGPSVTYVCSSWICPLSDPVGERLLFSVTTSTPSLPIIIVTEQTVLKLHALMQPDFLANKSMKF